MKYRKYKVKNINKHIRFAQTFALLIKLNLEKNLNENSKKLHQVHNICLIYKIKYITTFNSIYIIKYQILI